MSIPPAAVDLLAALAPVANRWGRWCVFGAQVVVLYGVPRLSADVDVTLALTPEQPDQFARDMAAAGFALRVEDAEFVRRTRVMPFCTRARACRSISCSPGPDSRTSSSIAPSSPTSLVSGCH